MVSDLRNPLRILIKLEDGGDPFFRQERVGRGGQKFKTYKFQDHGSQC